MTAVTITTDVKTFKKVF